MKEWILLLFFLIFPLFSTGCTIVGGSIAGGGLAGGGGAPTVSIPAPVVTRMSVSFPTSSTITVTGSAGAVVGRFVVKVRNLTRLGLVKNNTFEKLLWGTAYAAEDTCQTLATIDGAFNCTVNGVSGDKVDVQQIGLLGSEPGNSSSTAQLSTAPTVGGSVTGLGTSKSVILQNNTSSTTVTVSSNTTFTFAAQTFGTTYSVTVNTQPARQTCTVANGSGTIYGTNITNITVTCTTTSPLTFVTATFFGGDLKTAGSGANGIAGADSLCSSDTSKPATGSYKALIVDGTNRTACTTANCSGGAGEHTDWVLAASTTYYRSDGTTAIGTTTSAGIFSFNLTNSTTGAGNNYFTGLNTNWTTSTDTCTGWTTSAAVATIVGSGNAVDSNAINTGAGNFCSSTFQLLCVEQ